MRTPHEHRPEAGPGTDESDRRLRPGGGESPEAGGSPHPEAPVGRGDQGAILLPALEAARRGEPGGRARLASAARPVLLGSVGAKLAGGWTHAWIEDVVQEALLDILRSHRQCRAASEGEAVAWVVAIGRQEVATLFRTESARVRRRVRVQAAAPVAAPATEEPDERIREALDSLRAAARALRPAQHHLLWARLVVGMSWLEVGEELGVAGTAAKRRWQRLQLRLRRACAPPD